MPTYQTPRSSRVQVLPHSPYACSTCDGAWLSGYSARVFHPVNECESLFLKSDTILCLVRHQCMRKEGQVCCAFLGGEAVVTWPGGLCEERGTLRDLLREKKAQGQARWPHNSHIKFFSRPPFSLGNRESTRFPPQRHTPQPLCQTAQIPTPL